MANKYFSQKLRIGIFLFKKKNYSIYATSNIKWWVWTYKTKNKKGKKIICVLNYQKAFIFSRPP